MAHVPRRRNTDAMDAQHRPLILIVDADADVRGFYRALFEDEGYTVAAVPAPHPTPVWVRTYRPATIVLGLGVGADGEAGLGFLRCLRADRSTAGVPVVVCTGDRLPEATRVEILGLEASLLAEPFAIDDLLALVGAPTDEGEGPMRGEIGLPHGSGSPHMTAAVPTAPATAHP